MILNGQERDSDYYGMVAACVVGPGGERVYGINYATEDGTRVHAERAAIDAYGEITTECMIVTTLSPCNRPMDERSGESCEALIKDLGITHVYCGYKDPTQKHDSSVETNNTKLRELCKKLADTFLKENLHDGKKLDVTEAFDQPYAVQWTKTNGDWHATADLDDGSELVVLFMSQGDNQWMVEFERDENMEITGEGDAPRVFATVLTAMRQFIAKRKPAMLNFSAEKEDDPTGSRARLYDRMVQRYITGTGYDLTRQDYPGGATYTLTKQAPGVAEGLDDNGISFQVQKGKNKFATTLSMGNNPVGVYQYNATTGRSIAEVYPEFKGKGLGKLLVLHAIYTATQLGLDFQEDESRTSEYDNVLDSLSSNGYIVDDDGYWYVTGEGEQYLKQSLKQDVAENFADGRVKGKSRPGRVKRSGASCAGSVSDLRAKAKKYGGERGKMYHWCANMKGGRKK